MRAPGSVSRTRNHSPGTPPTTSHVMLTPCALTNGGSTVRLMSSSMTSSERNSSIGSEVT